MTVKRPITVTSWTMAGKRSDARSWRHGLARMATSRLTVARTNESRAIAAKSATSPSP